MSKYKTEFNEKQIEAVKDYLEKRFGCYGVAGYKLEMKKTERLTYQYCFEQELEPRGLGIFRHALEKCWLSVEVWEMDVEENEVGHRHLVCPGLHYQHVGGGTNGCDMNVKFYVSDDGRITEVY
jgi:hypothetical protein